MKRVSFDGIGQVLATFEAEEGVKAGQTVEMSGDGTVKLCANGKRPAGVAVAVRDGCAAVQVRGFVTVKAAGVTAGWVKLSADGSGGMKVDESMGVEHLVAEADDAAGTIVVLL